MPDRRFLLCSRFSSRSCLVLLLSIRVSSQSLLNKKTKLHTNALPENLKAVLDMFFQWKSRQPFLQRMGNTGIYLRSQDLIKVIDVDFANLAASQGFLNQLVQRF